MTIAIVSGSAGLIGSEATSFFAKLGFEVVGLDNDMRKHFFGDGASVLWNKDRLQKDLGHRYMHFDQDIRDGKGVDRLFSQYQGDIGIVIHTAAQPSHDWAATDPITDFSINATGTLILLEAARKYCPDAPFLFTSTNKVYGDAPNELPLTELETRWEIDVSNTYVDGIREDMRIDQNLHSIFGVSKASADLMVQEYGRYFGLRTACFRGGCLTGPHHSGAELHGFLAYLMKCTVTGTPYSVFGYKGKQVRDNIHSADLVEAFYHFFLEPKSGEVYNIGGGRFSNTSMLEAIEKCQEICGRELDWTYKDSNRIGDHIWWISDNGKFASHYPSWKQRYDLDAILHEIYEENCDRWISGRNA